MTEENEYKLYKKDSKGKVRVYHGVNHGNYFTISTGLLDGKLISKDYYPTPKGNRTLEEQVYSEFMSKYAKKRDRELYQLTPECNEAPRYTQPMLAHDATKVGHRIDWKNRIWLAQRKLNGVRCTAKLSENGEVILTSRKGKSYTVPHIQEEMKKVFNNLYWPDGSDADGELYIHGTELGDITHAVAHGDPQLEFRIFDMVNDHSFANRLNLLQSLKFPTESSISIVKTVSVSSHEDMDTLHDLYVDEGYEGLILRDAGMPYEIGKRSLGLFKYKKFQDSEFEIAGVEQDKDGGAKLLLITKSGEIFGSRPMGSDQYRKNLWERRTELPGKLVTVRYSNLLASGVPEFNRVLTHGGNGVLRDYE